MKILLASNNRHKQREIQQIFDSVAPGFIELLAPGDVLQKTIEVEETGKTLEENAYLKAKAFFDLARMPCIADDTGLEIDALNGAPGVHSARFAGERCDDASKRRKALEMLKGAPPEQRTARFRTVFCYIDGAQARYAEGICRGKIIDEERGSGGFGYDSLFVPEGFSQTFAEMSASQKNELSHRGKAALNLVEILVDSVNE